MYKVYSVSRRGYFQPKLEGEMERASWALNFVVNTLIPQGIDSDQLYILNPKGKKTHEWALVYSYNKVR